ncbi:hypothetical protein QQP08_004791 [Theobroma cacao]|nr:hypothetical protein QQP08_004791 [Theobroma cacao]
MISGGKGKDSIERRREEGIFLYMGNVNPRQGKEEEEDHPHYHLEMICAGQPARGPGYHRYVRQLNLFAAWKVATSRDQCLHWPDIVLSLY